MTETVPQPPPNLARQLEEMQAHVAQLARRMERAERKLELGQMPAAWPQPQGASSQQRARVPAPVTTAPAPRASLPLMPPPTLPRPLMPSAPMGAQPLTPPSSSSSRTARDWESVIGGKWALWIGSLSLFLAIASFLAYTWKSLPPPSPGVRVALGLGAGAAFLVAGAFFRVRARGWFSEGLNGAGLAILYLSIWAGAQYFGIVPLSVAFGGMALVTILGVFLAVRYDAVSLSFLATAGGFLTPLLLQQGDGARHGALGLLFYVALLNAGILALSLFKRWRGVAWLSFLATILLVDAGCAPLMADKNAPYLLLFAFTTLYFGMFLGTACFYSLAHREQTAPEDLLLLFADATIYAVAGYALLNGHLGTLPSLFPLGLAVLMSLMSLATHTLAPANATLRQSLGGLALLFFTIAIPIQFGQPWLAIWWSVEAGILLMLGLQLGAPLLQRAGQVVWALSLLPVLGTWLEVGAATPVPFFNPHAMPLLLSILVAALVAYKTHDAAPQDEWSPIYALYAYFAGAWLTAGEIYGVLSRHHWPSSSSWQAGALFVLAMWGSAYALGGFALGIRGRHATLRWSALAIAAASMALPLYVVTVLPAPGWTPFWNPRWLTVLVMSLALGAMSRMMVRHKDVLGAGEADGVARWPEMSGLFILGGLSLEVYFGFAFWKVPSVQSWPVAALFALSILWSLGALLLLKVGCAQRQPRLRVLATWIGAASLAVLTVAALGAGELNWMPLFNWRFAAFLAAVGVLAQAAVILDRQRDELDASEVPLIARCGFLAIGLLLLGLTLESYAACFFARHALGEHWDRWAQVTISLVWSVYGAGLLMAGVQRDSRTLRWGALALLGLAILKVFLFDLGFLDGSLRMLSLAGLGAALIFISWLYGRLGKVKVGS